MIVEIMLLKDDGTGPEKDSLWTMDRNTFFGETLIVNLR